ncbi:MAG: DUF2157 domain-containing protein [Candidatus Andersenbacteria bacterium]|nr:DUF2157 domain-containing protein [Candidatus Andersenbacteria bacterium]
MDKQEVLKAVSQLAAEGMLTREEVMGVFTRQESLPGKTHKLVEILYHIGGAIVCIGIAVLIGQNWDALPTVSRVLATLGAGGAALAAAVLFSSQPQSQKVALSFFMIAGVVLPIGLNVAWHESGYLVSQASVQSIIFAILLAVFTALWVLYRQTVLLMFTILFGLALYYVVPGFLLEGRPIFDEPSFTEYRTLLAGLSLVLLAYYFRGRPGASLTGVLYSVGSVAFLGAALALGGYQPDENVAWEVAFPLLAFGFIFGSVQLKSKPLLVFGTLFLIAYIFKLTAEYFSDSLGWPMALVVAGLGIIGIAYGSIHVGKRYLGQPTS